MKACHVGTYDDMGVWFVCGLENFVADVRQRELPKGLSVALVLGDRKTVPAGELKATAGAIAAIYPTVVHCFGRVSEFLHDAIDGALRKHEHEGVLTYWNVQWNPVDVIFELFRTDLPAESELARWSGRLVVLDSDLNPNEKEAVTRGLCDIDTTIKESLDNFEH